MTLVQVHLLELPVPLAAQAQQHFEELMREFALIASGQDGHDDEHHVPKRLLDLVDTLRQQFGATTTEPEKRLADAIDRGDEVIPDHVLDLPAEAGPASEALGRLIDEADDYCLRGKHLLTLATPPDSVEYRRWYLGQVVDQLAGKPPVPWPQHVPATPGS
ncbi:MAG: hypothetical protein ABR614_11335 [Mycobacteriales bacterium]